MRIVLVIILRLTGLTACKSRTYNSSSKALEKPPESLLIVSGGFNSCQYFPAEEQEPASNDPEKKSVLQSPYGQALSPLADEMLKKLPGNTHYITSCYDSWSSSMIVYGEGRQAIKSAVRRIPRGNDNSNVIGECDDKDEECFYKVISDRAKGKNVYIVGHSYGGWTAMKLAIVSQKVGTLRMLATVDPISLPHCASSTFVGSIFSTTPSADCTRAPVLERDTFLEKNLQGIADTRNWFHFWQEDYTRLHSGNITLENVNLGPLWNDDNGKISNTGTALPYPKKVMNAHVAISRDSARVWKTILKLLSKK